ALFARRLRDTILAAVDVVIGVMIGMLPLAFREASLNEPGHFAVGGVRRFIRPAAIVALSLLIFGSLLRGADPIFASLTAIPSIDMGEVISHILLSGFFAWVVAGWARAGLAADAGRSHTPAALPIQLDGADVTAAL